MFSIGHLSDLHATPLRLRSGLELLNKRFFGWLSWRMKRRRAHRPQVLEALLADLRSAAPDHVVITGDLTNVALEEEFPEARRWLDRIGRPESVSVVPGNHDAYVRVPYADSWGHWEEFMVSDGGNGRGVEFPTLRVRGPAAVVGVSSAAPTAPFLATGAVGPEQLARLDRCLAELADSSLFRVVLLHHPPCEGAVSPRRALTDGALLREVLARRGADLVLHGHSHRTRVGSLAGPDGPIPVVGVRSASDVGSRQGRRAQYHVYRVERQERPGGRPRFGVTMSIRGYDPATGRFAAEGERAL